MAHQVSLALTGKLWGVLQLFGWNWFWNIDTGLDSSHSPDSVHSKNYVHTVSVCCVFLWLRTDWFYPYHSGLLHWHWAITWLPQCQWSNHEYKLINHFNPLWLENTIKTKQSITKQSIKCMGYSIAPCYLSLILAMCRPLSQPDMCLSCNKLVQV